MLNERLLLQINIEVITGCKYINFVVSQVSNLFSDKKLII